MASLAPLMRLLETEDRSLLDAANIGSSSSFLSVLVNKFSSIYLLLTVFLRYLSGFIIGDSSLNILLASFLPTRRFLETEDRS